MIRQMFNNMRFGKILSDATSLLKEQRLKSSGTYLREIDRSINILTTMNEKFVIFRFENTNINSFNSTASDLSTFSTTIHAYTQRVIQLPFPEIAFIFDDLIFICVEVPEGVIIYTIALRGGKSAFALWRYQIPFDTTETEVIPTSTQVDVIPLTKRAETSDFARHRRVILSIFVDVLAALNTEGVVVEAAPTSKDNIKRALKNRPPIHTEHVIKFTPDLQKRYRQHKESMENLRLGPRLHRRRGHIRTLPSGVRTFVKHCWVGRRELGTVSSSYVVG